MKKTKTILLAFLFAFSFNLSAENELVFIDYLSSLIVIGQQSGVIDFSEIRPQIEQYVNGNGELYVGAMHGDCRGKKVLIWFECDYPVE